MVHQDEATDRQIAAAHARSWNGWRWRNALDMRRTLQRDWPSDGVHALQTEIGPESHLLY